MPQKPRTLISYRRDDASGWARCLYDRLTGTFGEDRVFIDFDGIGSGEDFEEKIVAKIKSSDVLLALLGKNWLNAKDDDGNRRLEQENDPVRVELRTGLNESLVLMPVLVDSARMPKAAALPTDIARFARLNAHELRLKTFHQDVDDLFSEIELQLKLRKEKAESASAEARIAALEEELKVAKNELAKERETKIQSSARKPFDAYLAYSHGDSHRLAAELQRALERYPAVGGRRLRVFRDSTDLAASPDLMSNITNMLDNSEYLILLASPKAAKSRWIEAELLHFQKSHHQNRILTVLADGDPESSIPMHLLQETPLYVDLRGYQDNPRLHREESFKLGVSKLVAALHEMPLDEVTGGRQGNRIRRRTVFAVALLSVAVFLIAIYLTIKTRA